MQDQPRSTNLSGLLEDARRRLVEPKRSTSAFVTNPVWSVSPRAFLSLIARTTAKMAGVPPETGRSPEAPMPDWELRKERLERAMA